MHYARVLAVVTDETASLVVARYGLALAGAAGAELTLLGIAGDDADPADVRRMEHHLDHIDSEIERSGISATIIRERGTARCIVAERARRENAGLVLCGSGSGGLLLPQLAADLVICRIVHLGRPFPRRILVPLGGVIAGIDARARFIGLLARAFGSEITLFHRPPRSSRGWHDVVRDDAVGMRHALTPDIARLREQLARQEVRVTERIGAGGIARSIIIEAASRHSDLIVTGASERGTFRRLLFGSPAGDIMTHAPCNAMLFRAAPVRP